MPLPPLSIVIPVYNEAGAIADTVARLRRVTEGLPAGTEVLLVDDGSRDGTAEVLARCENQANTRVITHGQNRGYGAALKTGLRAAANDWIAIADADGTYPLERIPGLLEKLVEENAAMVVGARPPGQQPVIRRPAKRILRALAEYLTARRIPDMNSGLRIFRRDDALRLRNLLPDGFSFTTTITMALMTEGEHVIFVPIRYRCRVGQSKIRPLRDTANFTMLICRTALAFNPMKVFGPVGAGLVFCGIVLLIARMFVEESFGVATTVTLLAGGLQILALGLLADLINRRSER
jgi:glycosyltransferase involved in cell wall biosynthesis